MGVASGPEKTQKLVAGVVVDVAAWKAPVISRQGLLKQPELGVKITFDPALDVQKMDPKQRAAFQKSFEALFDKQFYAMSSTWFREIQKYLDETENAIAKVAATKTDPKAVEKVVEAMRKAENDKLVKATMAWGKRAQEVVQKVYDAAVAQSAKAAKSGITKPRAKVVAKVSPAVGILPAKDLASLVSKLLGETKIGAKVQDGSLNLLPSDVKVVTAKYKDLDKNFAEVSKGGNELDGLLSGIRNEANEIGDLLLKSGMLEEIKKVTARPDPVEVKNLWDKNQETLKKLQSTLNQLDTQLGRIDKNIKNESSGFTSCIDAIGQLNITLKKGNEKSKRLSIQSLDVERNLKETKKDLETIGQAVRAGRSASVNFKSKDLAGFLKQLNTLTDTLNSVDNIEEKVKEVGPTISKLGIELEEIKKIER